MERHRRTRTGGLVVLFLLVSTGTAGAFLTTELVADGLNRPVFVTAPDADDRLFIVEQQGTIQLLKDGSIQAVPFLDINPIVMNPSAWSEQGLLGLAFHPDYETNRYFFVHYTDLFGDTVIARYETQATNPDEADLSTAEIVLEYDQPASNHNGGSLEFGPDGFLYFAFGDGGGAEDPNNNAQNPQSLLGKMIRIDVDPLPYTVPITNPFTTNANVLDEIWALGLRNPYRWSFDRLTGDLWIGDVGQYLWEEVSFQPASSDGGENYGWRLMEGFHCFNPPADCGADTLTLPIHEYGHGEGNCSITGGAVYRGADIPELQGYYLFGDYCSNQVWALEYDGSEVTTFLPLTEFLNPGGQLSSLAAIGEDGFGEVYLVDREGTDTGEIWKIVRDPTGVDQTGDASPALRLGPAVPNPSAAGTALELMLREAGHVSVRVFSASGRAVRNVSSEIKAPGTHRVEWDGTADGGVAVPSGIYFLRAEVDGRAATAKVSLVR
jgi:glucose/arabinose dehydrogenase